MKKITLFLSILFASFALFGKPTQLVFWHAMAGHLGDEVQLLADDFNKSQSEFFITPVYKGNYVETLTSFAAAFRAKRPPNIVQIFEVGSALMLSPKGVIKPVDELMSEQHLSLPQEDFIESVRAFYSRNGQLMAMPFNLSAPVLYYNKEVVAKAGFAEPHFPKTWHEMEHLAKKLKAMGYDCAYTSAYPGWVLFESYMAIHGLPLVQEHPAKALFDSPAMRHHIARLKRWQQTHYFKYGGRSDDASVLFTSGVCPLFSQSSGGYNSLKELVPFQLGVAPMPLDTAISTTRYANVAGGAALWAVAGQSSKEYQGIAQFFAFIAQPAIQKRWHEHTGYLPIGFKGGYEYIVKSSKHPTLILAKSDLETNASSKKMFRHLGPQNQIRTVNDEVLEALFAGTMGSKEALHQAVARANHLLLRFERNTG